MTLRQFGVSGIITALITAGTLATGVFFIEDRYAKCADVQELSRRLDYKIEGDKLMQMRQRLWQLEDRYAVKPASEPEKTELRELKEDVESQKSKVQQLERRAR